MNEFEPRQPAPSASDEASIREIMEHEGISFDEARQEWDMLKAQSNYNKLRNQENEESEDITNG